MARDNMILTGFMGAGKSTVGRKMAQMTGKSFLDTDLLIEEMMGMKISEIFEKLGEAKFREAEKNIIKKLYDHNNTVFATGGGMPLDPENREALKKAGHVIFLDVPEDILAERLEGCKDRPLLAGYDLKERIRELLSIRRPLYTEGAHVTVEVGPDDPQSVVMKIFRALEKAGKY